MIYQLNQTVQQHAAGLKMNVLDLKQPAIPYPPICLDNKVFTCFTVNIYIYSFIRLGGCPIYWVDCD